MRHSDAFTWYMENDPELRSTVVAVAWLESAPAWEDLVRRTERATRQVPSFRRRPVEVPGRMSTPRWTTDPHFDVAWHLRRVDVPAPHGRDEVLALAALGRHERLRPHPPAVGVHPGRRVGGRRGRRHHEDAPLAHRRDRGGAARAGALRRRRRRSDHGAGDPLPAAPPGEWVRGHRLVLEALADRAARLRDGALGAVQLVPGALARVARHPMGAGADVVETARSIGRTVRPLPAVLSPVMTERGPGTGACTPSPSAWTS